MAGDQRARRGHADEDRAGPGADRGRGLLAQRGVRLVADDDRVRVGDVARVADEPLVGLDRHRAVGRVLVAEQRGRDALRVAAVAQLAVELVDEVAAVGEDQDAAGARGLDEADRGDGLAGAGRVLEPEALAGVRVLGRLGDVLVLGLVRASSQSCGSSGSSSSSSSSSPRDRRPASSTGLGGATGAAASPFFSRSASSAVSVPESASTWCADSTVPSTSCGSSCESRRSSPSSSDHWRRQCGDGTFAPGLELDERSVERAPARRAGRERATRRPPPRSGRAHGRTPKRARSLRLKEAWPVRPLAWSQPWTARKVAVRSGRRLTRRTLQGDSRARAPGA